MKPIHYRWSKLAPQSIGFLDEANGQNWSSEKIADYLNCSPEEAEASLRRYRVSQKVNSHNSTPERIREAFFEWLGGVVDLDEKAKRGLAGELASIVANQLYAAAQAQEDLLQISSGLESSPAITPAVQPPASAEGDSPQWGPQWKS